MAIQPVVMDLFWNVELNGGKVEDVVQVIDDKKYAFNCPNCGSAIYGTMWDFLSTMRNLTGTQFNLTCRQCMGRIRNWSDYSVLEAIKNSELYEFTKKVFAVPHKELEVITHCPICGKLHSVKMRAIKRARSFICSDCQIRYGGKTFELLGYSMEQICPRVKENWSPKNHYSISKSYPLCYRHPYYLICPSCGKEYLKCLDSIQKTGSLCQTCAKHKSRMENVGSLRDVYPRVAKMWDEGNNGVSSDALLPSSTKIGNFVCRGRDGDLPPHVFRMPISNMAASEKKGNWGCPVCANKVVWTGINDFASLFPDAVKYWDYDRNEVSPEKALCSEVARFYLICPRCGKHINKRTDAVARSGAYCEDCTRTKNDIEKG